MSTTQPADSPSNLSQFNSDDSDKLTRGISALRDVGYSPTDFITSFFQDGPRYYLNASFGGRKHFIDRVLYILRERVLVLDRLSTETRSEVYNIIVRHATELMQDELLSGIYKTEFKTSVDHVSRRQLHNGRGFRELGERYNTIFPLISTHLSALLSTPNHHEKRSKHSQDHDAPAVLGENKQQCIPGVRLSGVTMILVWTLILYSLSGADCDAQHAAQHCQQCSK
jgi:hypothetical protein